MYIFMYIGTMLQYSMLYTIVARANDLSAIFAHVQMEVVKKLVIFRAPGQQTSWLPVLIHH